MADKRAIQSFGECLSLSEAVIIAATKAPSPGSIDANAIVEEVLYGNHSLKGRTLKFSARVLDYDHGSLNGRCLVFLAKDFERNPNPIIASYNVPDQIAVFRCVLPALTNRSERERLSSLITLFRDGQSRCHAQFVTDPTKLFRQEFYFALSAMREPRNLQMILELYPTLELDKENEAKLKLLDWLADTGDARVVPLLIKELKSPDKFFQSQAMTKLIFNYPTATGVSQALYDFYKTAPPGLKPTLFKYLSKYKHHPLPPDAVKDLPSPMPYQKAETLHASGKFDEATRAYVQLLQTHGQDPYVIRASALKALKHCSEKQRAQVAAAILPFLSNDAVKGNYLEATDTSEILRNLKSMKCLDALIALLDRRDFMFAKANRNATFAIVELGDVARKKAAAHLMQQIRASEASRSNTSEQLRVLLELAWIGESGDFEAVNVIANNSGSWKQSVDLTRGLFGVRKQKDEAAFLLAYLQKHDADSAEINDWPVFRLGDLRDQRAIATLVGYLEKNIYSGSYVVNEALESIGGEETVRRLSKVALNPGAPSQSRAMDIIANVSPSLCIPIARQIVKSKQFHWKTSALLALSRYGTQKDLEYLVPLADYWTGDRTNHYWAMQAITGIRDRAL